MKRILLAAALLLLLTAPTASADSIYWSSYVTSGAIRIGSFSPPAAATLFSPENKPQGIAIDAAAGKLYWADSGTNAIRVGNLDGSGARDLFPGESGANSVAIDPAAGKLYWTDYTAGAVRVGNLDGSGASTLFPGEAQATGIAIDPAAGKLYWGLYSGSAVRVGNINGSAVATLFPAEAYVTGVAVDPAAGKLYWTNEFQGRVRVGTISGTGAHDLYNGEAAVGGLALDIAAGKIYWGNFGGLIRVANLDGAGPVDTLFMGETAAGWVALLRAPVGAGAPQVTGGGQIGQPLSCDLGSWAPEQLGSFVYHAPQSFAYQWLKEGTAIDGAVTGVYTPFAPGNYSCSVIATNRAGATRQTSAVHAITVPPVVVPLQAPAKVKQLNVRFHYFFDYTASKRNRLTVFNFSELPSGAAIELRCHGKGCSFSRKAAKFKGTKANLVSLVRRARLARGAYFEVRISAPGYITEVLRFTAVGFHGGKDQRLCLPAGVKSPRKC